MFVGVLSDARTIPNSARLDSVETFRTTPRRYSIDSVVAVTENFHDLYLEHSWIPEYEKQVMFVSFEVYCTSSGMLMRIGGEK